MRVPRRKGDDVSLIKHDPLITEQKYQELKNNLAKLKLKLPNAREEVARLAEMGDFSENAAYQMAKGRLRGLNNRIGTLEQLIKHSQVIQAGLNTKSVQVGHTVKIKEQSVDGQEKIFKILGSSESKPSEGIISRNSPIGEALLGLEVGEIAEVKLANKTVVYKVIKID